MGKHSPTGLSLQLSSYGTKATDQLIVAGALDDPAGAKRDHVVSDQDDSDRGQRGRLLIANDGPAGRHKLEATAADDFRWLSRQFTAPLEA